MTFPIYIQANGAPLFAEIMNERESVCVTLDETSSAVIKCKEEKTCGPLQMLIDEQATQIPKEKYLKALYESKILIYG